MLDGWMRFSLQPKVLSIQQPENTFYYTINKNNTPIRHWHSNISASFSPEPSTSMVCERKSEQHLLSQIAKMAFTNWQMSYSVWLIPTCAALCQHLGSVHSLQLTQLSVWWTFVYTVKVCVKMGWRMNWSLMPQSNKSHSCLTAVMDAVWL